MKTYQDMLKHFQKTTAPKKNQWFESHIVYIDEAEEHNFRHTKDPEALNSLVMEYYQSVMPGMNYEVSALVFAASNGYLEFFQAFDTLPEAEKILALKNNNGGLALLYAVGRDHIEIVKILLKQVYIQNLLNRPYQIFAGKFLSNKKRIDCSTVMAITNDLPCIPVPKKSADNKENAQLQLQDTSLYCTPESDCSYGQLAYLISLTKSSDCCDLFESLKGEPLSTEQSTNNLSVKKFTIVEKLNFITQHLLTRNSMHNTLQRWELDKVTKKAIFVCSSKLQYALLMRHLSAMKIKNSIIPDQFVGLFSKDPKPKLLKSTPMIQLENIDTEILNHCFVIPAINWVTFCPKKLAEFTSKENGRKMINKFHRRKNPECICGPFDIKFGKKGEKGAFRGIASSPCLVARMPVCRHELLSSQNSCVHELSSNQKTSTHEVPSSQNSRVHELPSNQNSRTHAVPSNQNGCAHESSNQNSCTHASLNQNRTPAERADSKVNQAYTRSKPTNKKNDKSRVLEQGVQEIQTIDDYFESAIAQPIYSEKFDAPRSAEEIKQEIEKKQRQELEDTKSAIKNEIYFLPKKFDSFIDQKAERLKAIEASIDKRSQLLQSSLAKLKEAELQKQKAFLASEKSLVKRDPSKGKIASYDSKSQQVQQFKNDASLVLQKLANFENEFASQFKKLHIQILQLCDEGKVEDAMHLLQSLNHIFTDYEKTYTELLQIDSNIEDLEKSILNDLNLSKQKLIEQEEARIEAEKKKALEILAGQEKDAKIEEEQRKAETDLDKIRTLRAERRAQWFSEQAAYEAEKAKARLNSAQNAEQRVGFAPLYSRSVYKSWRSEQTNPKAPKPLLLSAKLGKVEYHTRLLSELSHIETVLKLIREQTNKNLGELRNERYAIRGSLARIFEVIRHLQGKIIPEIKAAALRLYLFKGAEFQIKDQNDLKQNIEFNENMINMTTKLLAHCRVLAQKKILAPVPGLGNLISISNDFSCGLLDDMFEKALAFMKQTECHRNFAPNLDFILNAIANGKQALAEINSSDNSNQKMLANFARIFIHANLGYHCCLLKKHYRSIYNSMPERAQFDLYIERGNAIRHEDSIVGSNDIIIASPLKMS